MKKIAKTNFDFLFTLCYVLRYSVKPDVVYPYFFVWAQCPMKQFATCRYCEYLFYTDISSLPGFLSYSLSYCNWKKLYKKENRIFVL
jgi:hypothetical protein